MVCFEYFVKLITHLVFAIREAATETLHRLTEKFGADWAVTMILPRITELANDTNYLHRMTCLFCFNALARALDKEKVMTNLFPTLKKVGSTYFEFFDGGYRFV